MSVRWLCSVGISLGALIAAPAAGAAAWKAENMVIPQTVQGQLLSVSCGAPGSCEGVGQVLDAQGYVRSLAESWNGSRWTTQSVPSFDAPVTSLSAVSCSGPSSCVAVGSYSGYTSAGMFAERWDGSSWTVQLMSNPPGTFGFLNSVACANADSCTAVGSELTKTGGQLPLVEVWNGIGWHAQQAPAEPGALASQLTGVSCPSVAACTAVGAYINSSGAELPTAESHTKSGWQLEALPLPSTAQVAFASAVSCSAVDECTLVGSYLTSDQELGLAERWNGFAWSQEKIAHPTGEAFTSLAGVSCTSSSACVAVGGAASPRSSGPLSESWNGSAWSVQATPSEPGGFLGSISCAAGSSCNAVGTPGLSGSPTAGPTTAASPAAIQPSGSTIPRPGLLIDAPRVGTLESAQAAAQAGAPSYPGVAALPEQPGRPASPAMYLPPALRSRLAATPPSGSTSLTLAEHWDGASWTATPTPAFAGAAVSQATGAACGSSSRCFVTGLYFDNSSGAELPLLERYDGTRWTIQAISLPAGAVGGVLFDVSCTAPNACTAVGEAFTPTGELAYAERWNGLQWTLQSVPGQSGLGTALGSVSCTAVDACMAAGAFLDNFTGTLTTLAEFWNGSKWSIEPTVNKSGNYSSYLYGVSCGAVDGCMAAGDYNYNGPGASGPLTESWSGTSWHLESMPAPAHASVGLPDPVSCSAVDACSAVGYWFSRTGAGAFADRWNGTAWAQQTVPTSLFALNGVGCVTATACLATSNGTSAVWGGVSWSTQSLAAPPVGNSASLVGVSCSAATADCLGAGDAFTGQPIPLAEGYS